MTSWLQSDTAAGQGDFTGNKRLDSGPFRWWLREGETKKLIFLTSGDQGTAPIIFEHNVRLRKGGKPTIIQVTCWNGMDDRQCPLCEYSSLNDNAYGSKKQLFTVIDPSEYVSKKTGKRSKYTRLLLAAPKAVAEQIGKHHIKLKEKSKGEKTLKYAQFEVSRTSGNKTPNVGDVWMFDDYIDPNILPKDVEEFDYAKEFEPNYDMLKNLVGILSDQAGLPKELQNNDFDTASQTVDFS